MMYGMFGFGWLMMLLVIGIPVFLIILIIAVSFGWFQNWNRTGATNQIHTPANNSTVNYSPSTPDPARYCTHCGTGLKSDWTHCPQCGAPIA